MRFVVKKSFDAENVDFHLSFSGPCTDGERRLKEFFSRVAADRHAQSVCAGPQGDSSNVDTRCFGDLLMESFEVPLLNARASTATTAGGGQSVNGTNSASVHLFADGNIAAVHVD